MNIGARVVRGLDWSHGESDGGEGHLGTVVKLCGQSMCDVVWDNGHRHRCRAGRDGKHDLLVLDTGPTGIAHSGILCDGCDVFGIAGTRWTCKTCKSSHLCSVCYGDAKHDITHDFVRYDTPGCKGIPVSPRQSSMRLQSTGLFQNAKVKKGPDWCSENKTVNTPGKILSVENHPSGSSARSMVKVEWEDGQSGLYRAGHEGKVDVQCITEYPGTFYYRDHLCTFTVAEIVEHQDTASLPKQTKPKKRKNLFAPEDKVCIRVSPEKLKEMQTKANIWNPDILRLAPRFGEVKSYSDAGHVLVTFKVYFGPLTGDNTVEVCEEALIKVPDVHEEDIVRMTSSESELRHFQEGHGFFTVDMCHALGKLGRVRRVTEAGDVVVSFGPSAWHFNPASCTLAPGQKEEKIEDRMAETLENIEIKFGNHVEMETRVNGVPTRDRGLVQKADAMFDAFSRGNFGLFMVVFKLDPRLKKILHKGYTPMILASATGASELVKMLIREGVDVNGKDADAQTPLLHAIYREQDETVPLLINSGCDVNLAGKDGITPLHLSAITERDDYIEMLLQKNADANKKDDIGNTTAHVAIELDQADIMATLLKYPRFDPRATNPRFFNSLQFATLKGGARYVEMILAKFPELIEEPVTETGFTCLHLAANNNHSECSRVLINKGHANVNCQNPQGITPLILACINLFVDIVTILLDSGADPCLADYTGDTPLHYALRSNLTLAIITEMSSGNDQTDKARLKIAKMLMDRGADLDRQNDYGISALDLSINDDVRFQVLIYRRQMRQAAQEKEVGTGTSQPNTNETQSKSDSIKTSNDGDNPQTSDAVTMTCSDALETSNDVTMSNSDAFQSSTDNPQTSTDVTMTSVDTPQSSSDPTPSLSAMTLPCSKCISNMVDVELRPCGHRLLCKSCVSSAELCPLCKENILTVVEVEDSKQTDQTCKVQ